MEICAKNICKLSRAFSGSEKNIGKVEKMIRRYHCSVMYSDEYSKRILEILGDEGIHYDDIMGNAFVFYVYSDNPRTAEILKHLETEPSIEVLFSKSELENANWYILEATRFDIETSDDDFTFEYSCPYRTPYDTRYRHQKQINPYVSKRTPKWKNNYNFCAMLGDFNRVFCSDRAKNMIFTRDIVGVDYMHVVNRRGESTENVSQMIFNNVLPMNCFNFIGEYSAHQCESCGKIHYEFKRPGDDNIRIRADLIPKGIDVFVTERSFSRGWIQPPIIISKKFYDLLANEMKEKHLRYFPIG